MKNKSLNLIPYIAYPYKVIYSYFANFYQIIEYNKIKNAVLKINDWNNEYFPYYLFFSIAFSFDYLEDLEKYIPYYELVFGKKFTKENLQIIKNIISDKDKKFVIARLFRYIFKLDKEEGFFAYIVLLKIINWNYDTLIVLPPELGESSKNIETDYVLAYFLNGIILSRKDENNDNILNDIIEYYRKNEESIKKKNLI